MALRDFARVDDAQTSLTRFNVRRFILHPERWAAYVPPTAVSLTWTRVKFSEKNAKSIPNDKCGVYSFVAEAGVADHPACKYLLYVGKVDDSNLRTRFRSYLNEPGKSKPRGHILHMLTRWPNHLWFYFCVLDPASVNIGAAEDDLIAALIPPMNRTFPATIRRAIQLVF